MGVADLRSTFNDVAAPAGITAARAELTYERFEDVQWQIITFRGTDAAGQPFVVRSERLRPETDLISAARNVATKMIAPAEGSTP